MDKITQQGRIIFTGNEQKNSINYKIVDIKLVVLYNII